MACRSTAPIYNPRPRFVIDADLGFVNHKLPMTKVKGHILAVLHWGSPHTSGTVLRNLPVYIMYVYMYSTYITPWPRAMGKRNRLDDV